MFSIDDFDEDAYEGIWAVFYDMFAMIVPDWYIIEMTDEEIESGLIYGITPYEDGDRTVSMMIAYYTPEEINNATSLEEVANVWIEDFGNTAQIVEVNGMPMVVVVDAETDFAAILMLTDTNYVISLGFNGLSNEDYSPVFDNMPYSLVATEELIEAVVEAVGDELYVVELPA